MSGEREASMEGDGRGGRDADEVTMSAKEMEELFRNHPLTEDTTCGIGLLRGQWLQRFSNEKYFVWIYGLVGCLYGAVFAYFNGTISTIEKRFEIPSKVSGIIVIGYDMTALLVGVVLSYYAGKQHRPRWICFGIYTVVLNGLLTSLPHFLYGPGEEALALTIEHGDRHTSNSSLSYIDPDLKNIMCFPGDGSQSQCQGKENMINVPAVILFLGSLIGGVGGGLYYNIGMSYMDDNIEKHKIPLLFSLSHFMRLLGPALGYSLASLSLELYIAPNLTPTITTSDPRWLGAWWMGWIVLSIVLFIAGSLLALFPKTLPEAAVRKMAAEEKAKRAGEEVHQEERPSFSDMMTSFWRLLKNKAYMSIQLSHMFYIFGYTPYWIFIAKYMETQYHISASKSSLVTGPLGIMFSAAGTLLAGAAITKYRPTARGLAWWNLLVVTATTAGIASYAFLGCQGPANNDGGIVQVDMSCNANCSCDHVRYTPVCSQYEDQSFISPCHAGCSGEKTTIGGTVVYTDCACIAGNSSDVGTAGGYVHSGNCPMDCTRSFLLFVIIMCILKFTGATSRSSNFLVSIRCVEERDKTVSMGLSMALLSVFTFIPSPVFYGYLIDKACTVWGTSCTGGGNCWSYDPDAMRLLLNFTSAGFIAVGAIFDIAVWYYIKDVKIFDEEIELENMPNKDGAQEKLMIGKESGRTE